MKGVPVPPRRVFGVDFSGAVDAGDHIWVCRAHPGEGGVRIESVDPLSGLPGGAAERDEALRALVSKVADAPRSAWGFDFPFALPAGLLADRAAGWRGQLAAVAGLEGPEALRDACVAAAGSELRRPTDDETATPFSPYNLRMYKQTYYGMAELLAGLHGRPGVAVLPFDPLPEMMEGAPQQGGARPAHIYLLEVCPASLVRGLGWAGDPYKGTGDGARRRRELLLRRLVDAELVRPVRREPRRVVAEDAEGNGLDAVLAAVAAWRGCHRYDHGVLRFDERYAVEGHVYL